MASRKESYLCAVTHSIFTDDSGYVKVNANWHEVEPPRPYHKNWKVDSKTFLVSCGR